MQYILGLLLVVSLSLSATSYAQNLDSVKTQIPKTEPFKISKGKSFAASVPRSANIRTPGSKSFKKAIVSRDFKDAMQLIRRFHVDGGKPANSILTESSISSMLKSLDPHSSYFDSGEFAELLSDQRSEYFGIGATIANFEKNGKVNTYVTSTFPDSPAFRAGLGFGDRILEVNGEDISRRTSLYVRDHVRGRKGSVVRLKVRRNFSGQVESIVIRRNRVAQPSIPDAYMLKSGIAYIDLSQGFNYTTIKELNAALTGLKRVGMTSLILDLRDNPGGILEQAIRVAEKFLPHGKTIATQRGRLVIDNRTWKSRNRRPETFPLVVLVNDESASASEIVAGALQDYDRALIVGEKTFGKGLVQSIINLPYGAGLTLTTAKYYTPSGRLIQRDYSAGNLYDYYQHNEKSAGVGARIARRTLSGRPVYSGDGIAPDLTVETEKVTEEQAQLIDSIFLFSRELAGGRIEGFEEYKVERQRDISKRIKSTDFIINDQVLKAFVQSLPHTTSDSLTNNIEREPAFVASRIRFNLVSAAYGNVVAKQVLIENDNQIAEAIQALPRAQQMAINAKTTLRKASFK